MRDFTIPHKKKAMGFKNLSEMVQLNYENMILKLGKKTFFLFCVIKFDI